VTPVRDLGESIDLFMGELALRKRTSETRRTYERILFQFADEVGSRRRPDEVTPAECRRFLKRWNDSAPATLALYVSCLKRFFEFLRDESYVETNPMERIHRPRLLPAEERNVVTVSDDDVARMFSACQDWQELLTIAVLAYLGPRRRAAAQLRQRDVDLRRGTMRFQEKGGKVVVKPMPDELVAILRAAWESSEISIGPDEYVIPNRRPASVRKSERSSKVIWETVRRVAARANVRSHAHALRAAFAVHFDETYPDQILTLKDLLGHARLETTLVYLRRRKKQLAMERVRGLSWGSVGGFVLQPHAGEAHTGFEPVLPP
jgi:integrase/recombinase XerD